VKPQEYFENVHRAAMVLTPKQTYFDWVKKLEPGIPILPEMKEPMVYLLPDFETTQEAGQWLRKHFDNFFQEKLSEWVPDEKQWPAKRTFKMFEEWFAYSLCTMVWDTMEQSLDKT
jgi:hypothetical protein